GPQAATTPNFFNPVYTGQYAKMMAALPNVPRPAGRGMQAVGRSRLSLRGGSGEGGRGWQPCAGDALRLGWDEPQDRVRLLRVRVLGLQPGRDPHTSDDGERLHGGHQAG